MSSHPPTVAVRTYRFLRLGVVAVIALLAVSIIRESFEASPPCLQGSISAYYFTAVRPVFVGALLILGFTMIVLWGKTSLEDSLFNLAGMLAPVVAFVPTGDTNRCLLLDPVGATVRSEADKQAVLEASHAAIDNNMFAYLVVLALVLLVLLVVGVLAQVRRPRAALVEKPYAFWGPWLAAVALWVFGFVKFNEEGRAWLYELAHTRAAILMFVLIVLAVVAVGFDKHRGRPEVGEAPERGWAATYWALAVSMSLGAAVIYFWPQAWGSADFFDHQVFWLEAWMITGLAAFWLLQTWDRWNDGAPPRTTAEVAQRRTLTADRASEQGVHHGGESISS